MPALIGPDGRHFQLHDGVVLGRVGADGSQPDVDLGILERGTTISRRHARIRKRGQDWFLIVESKVTNATKVAGKPVEPGQASPLNDGDEVELGAVPMVFLADWDSEATMVGNAQADAELRVDGMQFPLTTTEGRRLRIGRRSPDGEYAPDIDLRDLPGSSTVSHLHGHLVRRNGRDWSLHVVKTTNGTIVAGAERQPGDEIPLHDGDSLQLGRLRATFHQRPLVRVVGNELMKLTVTPEELAIEAGGMQNVRLDVVNTSGLVQRLVVELTGVDNDWFELEADGKKGKVLELQLNPVEEGRVGSDTERTATVTYRVPKVPASRAGIYPVSISATTLGEDQIRRVAATRLVVLPYEGLELRATPPEVKRSKATYQVEVENTGNAEQQVVLTVDTHNKKVKAEPSEVKFRLGNGHTRTVPLVLRSRRPWLGLDNSHSVDIKAVAGGKDKTVRVAQTIKPWLPRWVQTIVSFLYAKASPIALPAVTIALLLGVTYFLLRPPTIGEFRAQPSSIVAGTETQLVWTVDGGLIPPSGVSIEPPVGDKLPITQGQLAVSPAAKTEYTLTARNWLGLISASKKTTVEVLQIGAFKATPDRLTKEKEEVLLHWETQGATKIKIEPEEEVKDPKPVGDAAVHPTQPTTYKLTATGIGGVTATAQVSVAIGAPNITRFDVVPGPSGSRVYQGDPVQLTWTAAGFSTVKITASSGDVTPGQKELDVSGGPPAIVFPQAAGDVVYTLTASNAAGTTQATRAITVSPITIVQFEVEPAKVTPGQPAKLRWRIERPNDATKLSIEPGLGPVEGVGERSVSPTADTTYTLKLTAADGSTQERQVQIAVEVLPTVNTFTSPRPSITFGEEARLTWSVSNATEIQIRTADGITLVKTDKPEGTLVDLPPQPTTYILEAKSASGGSVRKDFNIEVKPPGATPAPTQPPGPAGGAAPAGGATPAAGAATPAAGVATPAAGATQAAATPAAASTAAPAPTPRP